MEPKLVIERDNAQLVVHMVPKLISDAVSLVVEDIKLDYHHQPEIFVYGRMCEQPRDIQFRSDVSKGYFYSGQCAEAQPLTAELKQILAWANALVGASFNGILINRYVNGTKHVGAHADSEAGLDQNAGVLAISHGVDRIFRIRDKVTKKIVKDVTARQGEAIQMRGDFQSTFLHEIPKQATIREERISFTFRLHDTASEKKLWDRHLEKVAAKQRVEMERIAEKQAMRERIDKVKAKSAVEFAEEIAVRDKIKRRREEEELAQEKVKLLAKQGKDAEFAATKHSSKPTFKSGS